MMRINTLEIIFKLHHHTILNGKEKYKQNYYKKSTAFFYLPCQCQSQTRFIRIISHILESHKHLNNLTKLKSNRKK